VAPESEKGVEHWYLLQEGEYRAEAMAKVLAILLRKYGKKKIRDKKAEKSSRKKENWRELRH
jgi:hypothetical protein